MMDFRRYFGPMPGRREAHAMAWMALTAGVILCAASVVLGFQGRTFMGRALGGDFVEFYTIGKILNTLPAAKIYDLELAVKLQHEILPTMAKTQMLVFGQTPYVAWLFRPFALLPYTWAYVAWLAFSAALYVAGLKVLFAAAHLNRQDRHTGFLLALSFSPFLFETWIGGQMATVVFFIWALFLWCMENERDFVAGLALSLCLFKPTLVALPAAMLFLARRWRLVSGLATGSAALALGSFFTVGWDGCRAWFAMLAFNAQVAAATGDAWHRSKYVDMVAFFRLLLGSHQTIVGVVLAGVAVAALGWLGRAWWRLGLNPVPNQLWAVTLCFTLVISAYTPIYDAVLAVTAIALLAAKRQEFEERDRDALAACILLLYMVSWLTQVFAEFLHIQLITLVLAGLGCWAGTLMPTYSKTEREESTMPRPLQPRVAGRF